MSRLLRRAASVGTLLLVPLFTPQRTHAQGVERFELRGHDVALYNLVGVMHVEGGSGDQVVVEVTRGGADAARLAIRTGDVRGRQTLRVHYPSDRIVYSRQRHDDSRSTFNVNDDDTFNDTDRGGDRSGGRRVEVSSSGSGLDAHADLRVVVPRGRRLFVRAGIGETTIDNVDGQLDVSVSASHVRVSRVRGSLRLDTGSGGAEVTDVTGDLRLDSGSGGVTIDGVRGGSLHVDVGSGSLRGRAIDVSEIVADVGSGGVRLSGVKSPRLHLETGSGGSDVELLSRVDDVSIEAGSGGVTLRLPGAIGAALDISTGSGGIETDFEVKVRKMERNTLRGTIGDGRGTITINAGSGTVRLIKS
jgi:lia operon protein LiaG